MCLSKSSNENEEALWSLRSTKKQGQDKKINKDKVIRLTLNIRTLLKQLDKLASKESFRVYVANVNYALKNSEILNLHDIKSPYYNVFFGSDPKQFDISNYLNLLLLKRKSFKYENEIRIIIVKEGQLFNYNNGVFEACFLDKSIINKIVRRIVVEPCNRLDDYNQLIVKDDYYATINQEEHSLYYETIKKMPGIASSIPVVKSKLYEGTMLLQI